MLEREESKCFFEEEVYLPTHDEQLVAYQVEAVVGSSPKNKYRCLLPRDG